MSKQRINVGTGINTGTGDTLRSAMEKVNNNFDELYDLMGQDSTGKSIDISGNTISSTFTNTDINISPNGSGDTVISSDLVVNNIKSDDSAEVTVNDGLNVKGTITATAYAGDGSGLTGVTGTGQGLTFSGDDSAGVAIADGGAVYIQGGTNITTSTNSEGTVKIDGPDLSSYATASSTTTFTNKTFDANGTGNTLSNIEVADFASGIVDTDLNAVSASDDTLASAKAIKAYVDANSGSASGITFTADDSAGIAIADGGAVYIQGGTNITTSTNSEGTVTVNGSSDIVVNNISSADSTGIDVNDNLSVRGEIFANSINLANTGTIQMGFGSDSKIVGSPYDGSTAGAVRIEELSIFENRIETSVNRDIVLAPQTGSVKIESDLVVNSIKSDDSHMINIKDDVDIDGTLQFGNTVTVNNILDEDDMSSNSAQALATQQSIKAYVDANSGSASGITFTADDSAGINIADGGAVYIQGGTNVTTSTNSDGTVTVNGSSDIVVNNISSADSTAVQINDGVNISGDTAVHGALKLAHTEADGSTATIDITKSVVFLQGGTAAQGDYQYVMPDGTYKGQQITLLPEPGSRYTSINVTINARDQQQDSSGSLDWMPFDGSGTPLNQMNMCVWDGSAWCLLFRRTPV